MFDELIERAKEKEEKEAKKRKRLADDFFHLLYSIKVLYCGRQLIGGHFNGLVIRNIMVLFCLLCCRTLLHLQSGGTIDHLSKIVKNSGVDHDKLER